MIFKGIDYGKTNHEEFADIYENDALDMGIEEERVKCNICEEYFDEDEINAYGFCEKCAKSIIENTSLDEVIEYSKHCDKDDLFILMTEYIFTKEQVIEMLIQKAKECNPASYKKDIIEFIECDDYHYFEYLENKGD